MPPSATVAAMPRPGHIAEHAAGFARPGVDGEGKQISKAVEDKTRRAGFTWSIKDGVLFVPFTALLNNRRYDPAHVASVLKNLTEYDTASTSARRTTLRGLLGEDVVSAPSR